MGIVPQGADSTERLETDSQAQVRGGSTPWSGDRGLHRGHLPSSHRGDLPQSSLWGLNRAPGTPFPLSDTHCSLAN